MRNPTTLISLIPASPSAIKHWHLWLPVNGILAELSRLTVPREMLCQGTEHPPLTWFLSRWCALCVQWRYNATPEASQSKTALHLLKSSPSHKKKIHQELAPPGLAYSSKLNIGREQTHQGTGSCLPTLLKWTVPGMALVRADEHALNQFLSVAQERTQARNPSQ